MSPQKKNSSKSPNKKVNVCSICLDELGTNNKTGLLKLASCGHEFHKDCIINWMKIQSNNTRNNRTVTCPNCRKGISFLDKLSVSISSREEYKEFI